MSQHYSNPNRADDTHALPDIETFFHQHAGDKSRLYGECVTDEEGDCMGTGWYYWYCMPGCLPDGDASGPFATEADALEDARDGIVGGIDDGIDDGIYDGIGDEAPSVERSAFSFFLEHAGYIVGERARGALALARAERAARERGWVYVWQYDDDADLSFLEGKDEHGRYLFPKSEREREHVAECCRLVSPCFEHGVDCRHSVTLASLSGIIDADAAYRRTVEAELASEALADIIKGNN